MIVDTSAIIAILRREPEADLFIDLLAKAARPKLSVANYVEASAVVAAARDPFVARQLDEAIRAAGIEIMPVTVNQGFIAKDACRDFGKGSGHPARLNFGDCFAYALAKDLDEPLLFKGDDFSHTDVRAAVSPG